MENEKPKSGKWKIAILGLMLLIAIISFKLAMASQCSSTNIYCAPVSCTMLTPPISCNSSYWVATFTDGVPVDNATLSYVNDGIYSFNFTQPIGDYLLALCDGTYKEVNVLNCSELNINATALNFKQCPYESQGIMVLIIAFLMAFIVIFIGVKISKYLGMFGGIILIVASLYYISCSKPIGILMIISGIVVIIAFLISKKRY